MSDKAAPEEDADRKHGGNIHNKAEKVKIHFQSFFFDFILSRLHPGCDGRFVHGHKETSD